MVQGQAQGRDVSTNMGMRQKEVSGCGNMWETKDRGHKRSKK
jgi:hypothetical protein